MNTAKIDPDILNAVMGFLGGWSPVQVAGCTTCLITNSTAEGVANSRSDVDVAIITKDPEKFGASHADTVVFHSSGFRIEAFILEHQACIDQLVNASSTDFRKISWSSFDFVQRISRGTPVYGDVAFHSMCDVFDLRKFCSSLVRRFMLRARDRYEDYLGFRDAGYPQEIIKSLRLYLGDLAEAALCSNGDTYIREKWGHRRLARTFPKGSGVGDLYTFIELAGASNEKDMTFWEKEALRLSMVLQLNAIFPFVQTGQPPIATFFTAERESRIHQMTSFGVLEPLEEHCVLHSKGRAYLLDWPSAYAYLSSVEPSGDMELDRYIPSWVKSDYFRCGSTTIQRYFAEIEQIGLVERQP